MGHLGRQLLLDGAKSFRDHAGQRRVGGYFPAVGQQVVGRRAEHGHRIHLLAGEIDHLRQHLRLDFFKRADAEMVEQ